MSSGSSLVQVTVIFFIGCLAVCAKCKYINHHCHLVILSSIVRNGIQLHVLHTNGHVISNAIGLPVAEQAQLYLDGHANASAANTTSADESKLVLKFCSPYLGCQFKDGTYLKNCWCCTMPGEHCAPTKQGCWDKCPACNPKCDEPPHQKAVEFRA